MAGGRPWATALGGVTVGAAGLAIVLGGVGTAEHLLVGGETREWCEGSQGYESNHGPVERCVRERSNPNLVAPDEHVVELHTAAAADRFETHPWPVTGQDVDVEFTAGSVTVRDEHGVSASYPSSAFDDAR